jgi:hypothetical protein
VREQLKALLEAAVAQQAESSTSPALGARAGWSAIRPRPEPASFSAIGTRGGVGAAASAVRSRLGP